MIRNLLTTFLIALVFVPIGINLQQAITGKKSAEESSIITKIEHSGSSTEYFSKESIEKSTEYLEDSGEVSPWLFSKNFEEKPLESFIEDSEEVSSKDFLDFEEDSEEVYSKYSLKDFIEKSSEIKPKNWLQRNKSEIINTSTAIIIPIAFIVLLLFLERFLVAEAHGIFGKIFFIYKKNTEWILIASVFLYSSYLMILSQSNWLPRVNDAWNSFPQDARNFFVAITSTVLGGMTVIIITRVAERINKTKEDAGLTTIHELAAGGDAHAQNEIGYKYLNGNGVAKSFIEAEKWFRKSAKNGNRDGQNNLGMIRENYHRHNDKSLINVKEAKQWYMKAQKQNNFYAMYNLGRIYEKGIGVDKNIKEAYKWYVSSSGQGYPPAHRKKGILKKELAKEGIVV